ncbi:MAG: hypothetical protein KF741_06455 [Ferruginibacter sp.]|nr:hypothetical protein [Bacteroidota bacterium]MBX2918872.1 hypothetical protein [Ferruginibacter sp.]
MSKLWKNVTSKDVLQAIALFDRLRDNYPKPKNTFLLHNKKKYPAKHIRGLAYKIANKKEISKDDYNGGEETAKFFRKLGFTVEYKKNTIAPKQIANGDVQPVVASRETPSLKGGKLSVVSQKNALQKLLQKHYGCIEIEKKFPWLKTPDPNNLPKEYTQIADNLLKYRNQGGFLKPNYLLACDIVLDDQKLIIEYDENQHFSLARQICLECYPLSIKLSYSKQAWISACQKINAKDNSPIDRDERRAYYDTVRDIEAYKNGYTLIRIKHGDVDWEAPYAEQHLEDLFSAYRAGNTKGISKHKIARLIVTGKQYYSNGLPNYSKLERVFEKFVAITNDKQHFEFVVTPGGFLKFEFPKNLQKGIEVEELEQKHIPAFQAEAESTIKKFLASINRNTFKNLQKTADYLTIGIDGHNPGNYHHIELVAVYDLHKEIIVNWTGKFYPTENQKRDLVKINDLNSHFLKLNNQNVVILGCHDLSVFNPRGQAVARADSWKGKTSEKFRKLCKKFKPDIILQHPHTTDTPNIWNLSWHTLVKELPQVRHFASGIKYFNWNGDPRGDLDTVLAKTKKGDVTDFVFE